MNNGFTFHLSLGLPLAVYFVEYIVVTLCSFNLPVFILFLADFFGFFSYMYDTYEVMNYSCIALNRNESGVGFLSFKENNVYIDNFDKKNL
jgi:hypothetical protein